VITTDHGRGAGLDDGLEWDMGLKGTESGGWWAAVGDGLGVAAAGCRGRGKGRGTGDAERLAARRWRGGGGGWFCKGEGRAAKALPGVVGPIK